VSSWRGKFDGIGPGKIVAVFVIRNPDKLAGIPQ
jgi:hypothetical protein